MFAILSSLKKTTKKFYVHSHAQVPTFKNINNVKNETAASVTIIMPQIKDEKQLISELKRLFHKISPFKAVLKKINRNRINIKAKKTLTLIQRSVVFLIGKN